MVMKKILLINTIKVLRTAIGIVTAMMVFYGIAYVLNYMYVNPNDLLLPRVVLHQFYEEKGKIENLYLGSSHVYCDINPISLDSINEQFNFNLATSGQLPNGTFHLLKEADRYNNLSHVYVELYYSFYVKGSTMSEDERIYTEFYKTWQTSDCMKFSVNKLTYMFSTARPEQYTDLCIPFSRYRTRLDDWDYIKQVMEIKQREAYINYENFDQTQEYMGKGYYSTSQILDDCNKIYQQYDILEENPIGETSEKYLRKTIEYCQKRQIPILLFISPIYDLQLISTEHYDNYINQVRTIADEYGVKFYDFNLAKEDYLPIQDGKYFRNIGHLNDDGASMFTPFFNEVVSGNESENEMYFYNSYADKLQNSAPEIYGIYYRDSVEGEGAVKTVWIASNRDSGMEYRIIITPKDGAQYVIQDFDENKRFIIPMGETGSCSIIARMKDTPDQVQTIEISY